MHSQNRSRCVVLPRPYPQLLIMTLIQQTQLGGNQVSTVVSDTVKGLHTIPYTVLDVISALCPYSFI